MLRYLVTQCSVMALACWLSAAAQAMADAPKTVHIAPGPLVPALESLSKQMTLDLFYEPRQLEPFRTAGISGDYTAQEAVRLLLKGTPMDVRIDPSGAMVVVPRGQGSPHSTTRPPQKTGAAGERKGGRGDSSRGRFSLAQVARGQAGSDNLEENSGSRAVRSDSVGLETVVVTARKKQELLIDVPVAATVLDTEAIDRYAITDLPSLNTQTPGVQITRFQGAQPGLFFIRGIGVFGNDPGQDSPVPIVVDGISISDGHIIEGGLLDLADVQVLKGPQTLFFGKNSPAGVIALDSKNPGGNLEGYVRASYGFAEEDPILEGAVSIPLTNTLSIRIAGLGEDMQGGYVTNRARPLAVDPIPDPIFGGKPTSLPGAAFDKYPQTKEAIGRFTALWKPGPQFDATLKFLASYFRTVGEWGGNVLIHCAGPHPLYVPFLGGPSYADPNATCGRTFDSNDALPPAPILDHFIGASSDGKPFDRDRQYLTSLKLDYRLEDMTFTSLSGWYDLRDDEFDNIDATVFAETPIALEESLQQFTQELRVASSFDLPINFMLGGFFEHQHHPIFVPSRLILLPQLPPGIPNQQQYAGASDSLISSYGNTDEDYSFYGDLDWKIVPTLDLTAGGRWTEAHKSTALDQQMNWLDVLFLGAPGGPVANSPLAPAGTVYRVRTRYSNFSPELTLSWRVSRHVMLYGAYKTGFLAGGISNSPVLGNFFPLVAPLDKSPNAPSLEQVLIQNLTFGQEKAKGEEVGVKGSFFGGALQGDLTLYHYTYHGLQVSTFHPDTTSFTAGNAGTAIDEGVELNTAYRVTDRLALRVGVEYLRLYYGTYTTAPCYSGQAPGTGLCQLVGGLPFQNLSNQKFGPAPLTVNLGATYATPITRQIMLGISADAAIYNSSPLINEQPDTANPAHTVLDIALRLYQHDGPLEVALIGTNVTNAFYTNYALGKGLGAPQDIVGVPGPAREVRLQGTYRF